MHQVKRIISQVGASAHLEVPTDYSKKLMFADLKVLCNYLVTLEQDLKRLEQQKQKLEENLQRFSVNSNSVYARPGSQEEHLLNLKQTKI